MDMISFSLQYRLETFSESRISEWTFQPFTSELSEMSVIGSKSARS